jgi:hypothetical protein
MRVFLEMSFSQGHIFGLLSQHSGILVMFCFFNKVGLSFSHEGKSMNPRIKPRTSWVVVGCFNQSIINVQSTNFLILRPHFSCSKSKNLKKTTFYITLNHLQHKKMLPGNLYANTYFTLRWITEWETKRLLG